MVSLPEARVSQLPHPLDEEDARPLVERPLFRRETLAHRRPKQKGRAPRESLSKARKEQDGRVLASTACPIKRVAELRVRRRGESNFKCVCPKPMRWRSPVACESGRACVGACC